MIRLKVFINSVQKELHEERMALSVLLATDPFLSDCMVPRLFEKYPAPLHPNKQGYLELLRSCHVFVLIAGSEYGTIYEDGLSATHQEYRLAQELKLPTLVCVKGSNDFPRDDRVSSFLDEIRSHGHTYSRFHTIDELVKVTRARLIEYTKSTFDTLPTKQQETQAKEAIRSASLFERQFTGSVDLSALDMDLARQLAAAAEDKPADRLTDDAVVQALVSRGYLWFDQTNGVYRPSMAAVLLLAKAPSSALPQARLQLDAYAGETRDARPIDSVFVDEPLPFAIERAVAFILRNTRHPLQVKGLRRLKTDEYPQEALREAVVNAVAHRDYEEAGVKVVVEVFQNRVVICSPGLPPGDQSIDAISRGDGRSRARNPLVVQGLTWLELMDERGSGIRRMREAMKKQGLELPRFSARDHEFTVTLSGPGETARASEGEPPVLPEPDILKRRDLSGRQRRILERIAESGFVTTADCVQVLGIAKDTAWRDLNDLVEKGLIEKSGTGKATRYVMGSDDIRRKSDANQTILDGTRKHRPGEE
jgi:predicted HTH transcriptional regulator